MLAKKKNVSWGMFAVAFLFLFNPTLAIIDPLPDFIGYIIISIALSKISMISESLYDAKRAFERLVIIDVGKLAAVLWVFGIDAGGGERNTSLLLWSFVFGVLEVLFAIPAYSRLFNGFTTLGNFYPNVAILGKKGHGRESYTDFAKKFSIFFVVFKAILVCLPEVSVLSTAAYNESSHFVDIYRYIGVMRAFCVIPIFFVGIAWLASVIKYFVRISKDKVFVNAVNAEYSQKELTKIGAFVIKDVKIATFFMILASVFSIDFDLDGINILPDILVVALLGLSLFYFSKTAKIKKGFCIGAFVIFAFVTVLEDYSKYYFDDNFYYNAISKNGEAFGAYLVTVVAAAIEGLMLALIFAAMAKAIRSVVVEHTGYVLGKEIESEGEQKQIAVVQARLNKNFSRLIDFAVVCALADTFGSLYGAFYAFLNKNFGWMSLLSIICGLLLVGMTVKAVSELKEAVQTKYMLE